MTTAEHTAIVAVLMVFTIVMAELGELKAAKLGFYAQLAFLAYLFTH